MRRPQLNMLNINSVEYLCFITPKRIPAFSNFGNESAFATACGMVELRRGDQVRQLVGVKGSEVVEVCSHIIIVNNKFTRGY